MTVRFGRSSWSKPLYFGHAARIILPPFHRPMFGVIADAKSRKGHVKYSKLDEGFGDAGHIDLHGEDAVRRSGLSLNVRFHH